MDFAEAKGKRNPKSMWERCSPHGTETWITFLPPSLTHKPNPPFVLLHFDHYFHNSVILFSRWIHTLISHHNPQNPRWMRMHSRDVPHDSWPPFHFLLAAHTPLPSECVSRVFLDFTYNLHHLMQKQKPTKEWKRCFWRDSASSLQNLDAFLLQTEAPTTLCSCDYWFPHVSLCQLPQSQFLTIPKHEFRYVARKWRSTSIWIFGKN